MQKEKEEKFTKGTKKELKRKAKKGKEQEHVPTCSEKEPNKEEEERPVIDERSIEEEIIED